MKKRYLLFIIVFILALAPVFNFDSVLAKVSLPKNKKIVVFQVDQGLYRGLFCPDLTDSEVDYTSGEVDTEAIDRVSNALKPLQKKYNVYVDLSGGVNMARLEKVLDRFSANGIPFVLDIISSDIKGLSDPDSGYGCTAQLFNEVTDRDHGVGKTVEEVQSLKNRYGDYFAGMRMFEFFSSNDHTAYSDNYKGLCSSFDCTSVANSFYDTDLMRSYLELARQRKMFVALTSNSPYCSFNAVTKNQNYNDFNSILNQYRNNIFLTYENLDEAPGWYPYSDKSLAYRWGNEFDFFKRLAKNTKVRWGISNQSWAWDTVNKIFDTTQSGSGDKSCVQGAFLRTLSCGSEDNYTCENDFPIDFIIRQTYGAFKDGADYVQFEAPQSFFNIREKSDGALISSSDREIAGTPNDNFIALQKALVDYSKASKNKYKTQMDISGGATDCNRLTAFGGNGLYLSSKTNKTFTLLNKVKYAQWSGECDGRIQKNGGVGAGCCELACGASKKCDEMTPGERKGSKCYKCR